MKKWLLSKIIKTNENLNIKKIVDKNKNLSFSNVLDNFDYKKNNTIQYNGNTFNIEMDKNETNILLIKLVLQSESLDNKEKQYWLTLNWWKIDKKLNIEQRREIVKNDFSWIMTNEELQKELDDPLSDISVLANSFITNEQREKFFKVMINEKLALDWLEKEYNKEIKWFNEKHLKEWQEIQSN